MIYDLPRVKGALKPLPLAAPGVVIAPVIVVEVVVFGGYPKLRDNTGKVSKSQETILATKGMFRSILNDWMSEPGHGSTSFVELLLHGAVAAAMRRDYSGAT